MKKLFAFIKPYWHWALLAPLLMGLEVGMDLMQPRMIQRIVDEGIAQYDMQVVLQTGLLMIGFALIALSLPPSSQDQIGAMWGYGGAALLYTIAAAWLRQPSLLIPACALSIVPYAVGLQRSTLAPEFYGLALYPGALAALGLGWVLDARLGDWRGFPWLAPVRWPVAIADRSVGGRIAPP